jgi:hypothetical protein
MGCFWIVHRRFIEEGAEYLHQGRCMIAVRLRAVKLSVDSTNSFTSLARTRSPLATSNLAIPWMYVLILIFRFFDD